MTAGEITSRLAKAFSGPLGGSTLLGALLPLLAEGKAVAPTALAEALGWTPQRVGLRR